MAQPSAPSFCLSGPSPSSSSSHPSCARASSGARQDSPVPGKQTMGINHQLYAKHLHKQQGTAPSCAVLETVGAPKHIEITCHKLFLVWGFLFTFTCHTFQLGVMGSQMINYGPLSLSDGHTTHGPMGFLMQALVKPFMGAWPFATRNCFLVWAVSPHWTSSYTEVTWSHHNKLRIDWTLHFAAKATLHKPKDLQTKNPYIFNLKNIWYVIMRSHTKSQSLHSDGHHRSHPSTSSEKSTRIGTPVFRRYSVLRRRHAEMDVFCSKLLDPHPFEGNKMEIMVWLDQIWYTVPIVKLTKCTNISISNLDSPRFDGKCSMAKVQQYPTGPDFLGVAVHDYYSEGLKSAALMFLFYLLYLFCSHRGVFLVYVQVALGLRQKTWKQFVEVQTEPILKEMIQMKNHQIPIFPGSPLQKICQGRFGGSLLSSTLAMHPSMTLAESILQMLSFLRRDVRPGASKRTQKLPPHSSDIHGDVCFSARCPKPGVRWLKLIEIVRK